jgi:hypothetical protein
VVLVFEATQTRLIMIPLIPIGRNGITQIIGIDDFCNDVGEGLPFIVLPKREVPRSSGNQKMPRIVGNRPDWPHAYNYSGQDR